MRTRISLSLLILLSFFACKKRTATDWNKELENKQWVSTYPSDTFWLGDHDATLFKIRLSCGHFNMIKSFFSDAPPDPFTFHPYFCLNDSVFQYLKGTYQIDNDFNTIEFNGWFTDQHFNPDSFLINNRPFPYKEKIQLLKNGNFVEFDFHKSGSSDPAPRCTSNAVVNCNELK